eukprot:XP_001699202.1 hypothetical protein CHLREDRAFT_206137 [Chlamydomonas reinhardtii]
MAFSFGAAAPATSPFGGGGLFGAAPAAPAASSAPATGGAFAFGASTTPAFGAMTTSAFGAPAAPGTTAASPFGAAPAAPAANPFSAPTAFGTTGLFGQPASAQTTSNALVPATGLFGAPAAQTAQAQAQAQAAGQARPGGLNYKTKFEELPPQMQQELQKIQQEVSAYRDECKALEADARLHDTEPGLRDCGSAADAAVAAPGGGGGGRGAHGLQRVMVLLRSTESAIRLYQRSKLWRELQAVADQISQPVQLPNPYLGLAVRGFSEALEQYHRALPTLVSRMHDYFVHVAARLERLHGEAYLAARRARGDYGDPFADARPLHHMSKAGVNPKSGANSGGANNGGGTFYSFGGPASNTYGAAGLGHGRRVRHSFDGGGLGAAAAAAARVGKPGRKQQQQEAVAGRCHRA